MRKFVGVWLATAVAGALFTPAAAAPGEEPSLAAVMKRLDTLEQENRTLRQRIHAIEGGKQTDAKPVSQPKPVDARAEPVISARAARDGYAAIPAVRHDWSGAYFGVHAGAGLTQNDWSNLGIICASGFCPNPALPAMTTSALGSGILGGLQAGYNYQFQHWLVGIQGQYSFAGLSAEAHSSRQDYFIAQSQFWPVNGSETLSTRLTGLGAVGLRLGYAPEWLDGLLVFGTVGAAYARARISENYTLQYTPCHTHPVACGAYALSGNAYATTDSVGWFVGFGGEFALTRELSASLDYQWFGFGTQTVSMAGSHCWLPANICVDGGRTADLSQRVQTLKFGLNYHLH